MSKEAFLLLACIQSCRGGWGLNMSVDILRGSRVSSVIWDSRCVSIQIVCLVHYFLILLVAWDKVVKCEHTRDPGFIRF